jgi:hypothetical protein
MTVDTKLRDASESLRQATRQAEFTSRPPASRIQHRRGPILVAVAGAVAVLALFTPILFLGGTDHVTDPTDAPPQSTVTTSPQRAGDPTPFLGSWLTTEIEGFERAATLVLVDAENGSVEMTVRNFAVVCTDAPSTMTGTGRVQDTDLVFPAPVVACDGGSRAEGVDRPTIEDQFQSLTFTRDPVTDMLTDNFGHVWVREGAEDKDAESTQMHSEAEIADLLNHFIDARVAGEGAQQYLNGRAEDVPLLYATSSGEPYERGEFEQEVGAEWPYGWSAFKVRLFSGNTVVEQVFFASPAGRLGLNIAGIFGTGGDLAPTTEDGRPVAWAHDYFDGEVTIHAAHPWAPTGGGNSIVLIPAGAAPTTDGGERRAWKMASFMTNPGRVEEGCRIGPAVADAEALVENLRSYPGLETTAPIAFGGGGAEGLMMDVVIADGANACYAGVMNQLRPGYRMRLYLFDAPGGSSMSVLAIPLVVPELDFERAVENTAPITVEFHAP